MNLKIVLLFPLLAGLSACARGELVSEKREFWASFHGADLEADSLVWCRANDDGKAAKPVCYKPEFVHPKNDLWETGKPNKKDDQ